MSRRCFFLVYSSLTALQWLFFVTAFERPAYGYVDPGSGMLVVQFVGSVLSGGIFFLRRRLRQFFFPDKSTQASDKAGEMKP